MIGLYWEQSVEEEQGTHEKHTECKGFYKTVAQKWENSANQTQNQNAKFCP